MNKEDQKHNDPAFSGASPEASATHSTPFAVTWTDAETGESFIVHLTSSPDYLAQLETVGFEHLAGIRAAVSDDRNGGRSRVRSSVFLSGDKTAGSTHPLLGHDDQIERESA